MTREVVFAPEAKADLLKLYDDIAATSGAGRALSFTDRIVTYCLGLDMFPERGRRRDDLRPGLRLTTLRRRITIAFHIKDSAIIIDRILYGGRDLRSLFEDGEQE